jgi:hypothetical protein
MRTNPYFVSCSLFLVLTTGCVPAIVSAASNGQSTTATRGGTVQWQSLPEDSRPWSREPFKSPETTKPAVGASVKSTSSELILQGIMKSNKQYYAIINGRSVKAGDIIDGWSITEISRYRVTTRREQEKQIYDIYQGKIDRGTR